MPVWSDPGQLLVREAGGAGHYASTSCPGPRRSRPPSCHSGFPADEVRFIGFPPRGGSERTAALAELAHERATVADVRGRQSRRRAAARSRRSALPDAAARGIVIARELTKLHQEVVRGTVAELAASSGYQQGEVTVVVAPATLPAPDPVREAASAVLDAVLDTTAKPRERARRIAALTGIPARDIYRRLGTPDDD